MARIFMGLTSLISAIAAIFAAVLAALNLVVSGRRERHRWVRDSLVEVVASYLKCSFNCTHQARRWWRSKLAGEKADVYSQIKSIQDDQLDTLTRIRLLATADVVQAATLVRSADAAAIKLAFEDTPASEEEMNAARQVCRDSRKEFIRLARRSMKIPGEISDIKSASGK